MPEPGSIIPSSEPEALAASAFAPSPLAAAPLRFTPGVSEAEFLKHFPLPYKVQAVTIYEAAKRGWATDRSYWRFLNPFRYVSAKWGPIDIPKGFYAGTTSSSRRASQRARIAATLNSALRARPYSTISPAKSSPASRQSFVPLSTTIRRSFCSRQRHTIFFSRNERATEPAGGWRTANN